MAEQSSTEQLLELLVQLKKTTSNAARDILSSQPAIAYALISLMVSVGAIDVEVFQKTLSQYHEFGAGGQPTSSVLPVQIAPTSANQNTALPFHLQPQYQTSNPPTNTHSPPTGTYGYQNQQIYPNTPGYSQPAGSTSGYPSYGGQSQAQPSYSSSPSYPQQAGQPSGYGAPPTSVGGRTQGAPVIEMLAAFPEEQKQLIMHVVSMTPEQLNSFPPEQRNTYIQIRTTLGIH